MWLHHRTCLVLTALALGACDRATDDLPRHAVSGRVTLNGQPLAQGMIQFQPAAGPGAGSMSGGCLIKDGSYSIPRDQGLVPGNYKVAIFGAGTGAAAPKDEAPGRSSALTADPVPSQYNVQTTLSAEVKSDAANRFDFELKK
jgi:hypothetical protein